MLSEQQLQRATEGYRRGYTDAIYNRYMPGQGTFLYHDYYEGVKAGASDKKWMEVGLTVHTNIIEE